MISTKLKTKQTTKLTVLILFFVISMCFINLFGCGQAEKQSGEQVENQSTAEVEKETIAEVEPQSIEKTKKEIAGQIEKENIKEIKKETTGQTEKQSIEEPKKEAVKQVEKQSTEVTEKEITKQAEEQSKEDTEKETTKLIEKQSTKEAENQLDKENEKQTTGQVEQIPDKWGVPAKYKIMKNPTDPSDKESMAVGKSLYAKHCKSCHGKTGEGDGPKSAELDTPSGDFTTEKFQLQTDGVLLYKISEGRDDMPSFKKKIPDGEDRWLIVNYLRTLK